VTSAAIGQLDWVLGKISDLAALGQERYDADELVRWSIERLWIFAGNLAERHRLEGDVPPGVFPWSDLVAARNVYAHYLPDQISYDRLWHDTTSDLPALRDGVAAALRQRPG
jgi:uncharacterized protein with HEPN domain